MKATLLVGLLALIALPVLADDVQKVRGTRDGKPYFEASQKISEQATVIGIDAKTRMVTLREESGDTTAVEAGPEVKNFAQIKVNDVVKISYTQKLTVTVQAAGTPELTKETMTAQAKPGEMPGASQTEKTTYKATIMSIDKAKGSVLLKGIDGEEFSVWPEIRENLDKVAVGEIVVFTYTEAVAAKVEKAAPKKNEKKK